MIENIRIILILCSAILSVCIIYFITKFAAFVLDNEQANRVIRKTVKSIKSFFYPVRIYYRINKAKKLNKELTRMVRDYKRGAAINDR